MVNTSFFICYKHSSLTAKIRKRRKQSLVGSTPAGLKDRDRELYSLRYFVWNNIATRFLSLLFLRRIHFGGKPQRKRNALWLNFAFFVVALLCGSKGIYEDPKDELNSPFHIGCINVKMFWVFTKWPICDLEFFLQVLLCQF